MPEMENIGSKIRELRKIKGYTQAEFAKKIGYSKSHLSKIENEKVSPSFDMVNNIAIKLGVSLNGIADNKPEDYELEVVKSFIEFVRITTANKYFNKKDNVIIVLSHHSPRCWK